MSGWPSSASTATLSPCTTLNTPSGSPASARSLASRTDAEGSFSDGLSTKALPAAMAIGNIHIGTMAGKLNGVIPATTLAAGGCLGVDAGADVLAEAALEQVRDAAGELDDLKAAGDLARGVRGDLAVLARDQRGEVPRVVLDQLAEGEQHRGPLGQGDPAPGLRGLFRGRHRVVDVGPGGEVDGAGDLPGGRVVQVAPALRGARPGLAADPVGNV